MAIVTQYFTAVKQEPKGKESEKATESKDLEASLDLVFENLDKVLTTILAVDPRYTYSRLYSNSYHSHCHHLSPWPINSLTTPSCEVLFIEVDITNVACPASLLSLHA